MGIAVAALAAAGLVVTSHMLWVDAFDRQAPRVRLSSSIREKTALAHLWLEEGIAGDRSVDPDRDVRAPLDEVLALIKAARSGGATPFGHVPPASDPGLRAHLDALETQVLALRETGLQRWKDARGSGAPGMPRDQVFDQLFRETLALASTIGSEIDAAIARDRRAVLLTNGGIALVFLGLLVGIHVVLARHRRALEDHAAELERKVAERTDDLNARNADLALARDRADDANKAKSAFLATMSHEIRTPMNAIVGMSSLLMRSELPAEQHRSAEVIGQAGHALLRIIDDILDLSKIEAGRLSLEPQVFELGTLVDGCLDVVREAAARKGIGLAAAVDRSLPPAVEGDPIRLRQVLVNLLGNGVKFTDRGRVDLVVAPARNGGARVRFEVRDTGIGISPEASKLLFAPFSQVDQSRTRRFGGTGLGLAISKRLAELMGGTIGVESDVRRGSTFWVEIPLAAADRSRIGPAGDGGVRRPGRIAASADSPILVVEDNALNREVLTKILGALGHPSHTAASGEEALLALRERTFGAILMDCEMPGMDGYATIAEIRRREAAGSRIPIIVVSAHAMAGERERALEAGADGFLPKPVIPEDLAEALGGPRARAAEPAAPQAEVIDVHALERLRAVSGSREEFVSEMVDLFLQDAPAQIDLMRGAFSNRDASKLHASAHRLVGSCRYLGAIGMTRTLDAIRVAAGSGSWNRVASLLGHLDADLAAARHELVRISKAGARS